MYIFDEKFKSGAKRARRAEKGLTSLLEGMNKLLPEPVNFKRCENNKNFDSDAKLRIGDAPGDSWYLGYSERSAAPGDVSAKKYYIGGNLSVPPRRIKSVLDDIMIRAIAISDGGDRPAEVFCTVDCIGLTAPVISRVRRGLDGFCRTNNVSYINILSTHAHSSVDTMGIWSVTGEKFFKNISELFFTKRELTPSVDEKFIDGLVGRIKKTVSEAVDNMAPGRLMLAQIGFDSVEKLGKYSAEKPYEDMTLSEYGLKDFIFSKRPPREYSPRMNRLRFIPADMSLRETVIVNFGAHPYANGMKIGANTGDRLSSDFPFYMAETVNSAGKNFIFFNAAVNGIYPNRGAGGVKEENFTAQTSALGRDLGKLTLALTKTREEIEKDPLLSPENSGEPYRDAVRRIGVEPVTERELEPRMTSAHKKILLSVDNPLEKMIGKLGFASFELLRPQKGVYELLTETGYVELGGEMKIVLVPGEITPGLVSGTGDMLAENSITGCGSDFESIESIVGGDTAVFGLANDAIGYIIPDNDYCMFFLGYGKLPEKLFFKDYAHYQEMFSLGSHTASAFASGVKDMMEQLRARRNNI